MESFKLHGKTTQSDLNSFDISFNFSILVPVNATIAPTYDSFFAIEIPILPVAPVKRTFLPFKSNISILSY